MTSIECPICLDEEKDVYVTLICGHQLCKECEDELKSHNSYNRCPLCRTPLNWIGLLSNVNSGTHVSESEIINAALQSNIIDEESGEILEIINETLRENEIYDEENPNLNENQYDNILLRQIVERNNRESNTIARNTIAHNTIAHNTIAHNTITRNTITRNTVSGNTISVSRNTITRHHRGTNINNDNDHNNDNDEIPICPDLEMDRASREAFGNIFCAFLIICFVIIFGLSLMN